MNKHPVSEGSTYGLVGLSRTAYRHMPIPRDDEESFRAEVIRLICVNGRYSYRTVVALMRNAG